MRFISLPLSSHIHVLEHIQDNGGGSRPQHAKRMLGAACRGGRCAGRREGGRRLAERPLWHAAMLGATKWLELPLQDNIV